MADCHKLVFETSAVSLAQCPTERWPEVALSGRSNVGKSSLLNKIANRKALAKVSQRPGKTQMLNFFHFQENARLVDLPGYGYAKVPANVLRKWRQFMSDYLEGRDQLAGIVQLVDCRHAPTTLDGQMVEWLVSTELPFLIVLTKADKIKRGARQGAMSRARKELGMQAEQDLVFFSIETGEGKKEVQSWIDRTLGAWQGEAQSGAAER
jgi:GTP-binding protein